MERGGPWRCRPARWPRLLPATSGDLGSRIRPAVVALQINHQQEARQGKQGPGDTRTSGPPDPLPRSHSALTTTVLTVEPCRLVALQR